ncbi:6756_t:CDS:2 [Acaulospora colombiana]|uniref:6756_t:CDS:1 n=1 Tax=Acaulospora colombiana TaxID=27376 RepID=A0ACA9MHK0_9GLOM|nr:6756_t:CDS:2 [Acaulospora colombiana]
MRWLIVARGLSGIGGGGIVNSVWVLTTEIVPPGSQAKWSQALSVTWSASAVAGPILGGSFVAPSSLLNAWAIPLMITSSLGSISWRWALFADHIALLYVDNNDLDGGPLQSMPVSRLYSTPAINSLPLVYINLPIGMAALTMLWYFLRRVHLVRKLPDGSEDTRPRNVALKHALRTIPLIQSLSFAVMNPPALYTTSTSLYDTVGEELGSHICLSPSFYLWLNRPPHLWRVRSDPRRDLGDVPAQSIECITSLGNIQKTHHRQYSHHFDFAQFCIHGRNLLHPALLSGSPWNVTARSRNASFTVLAWCCFGDDSNGLVHQLAPWAPVDRSHRQDLHCLGVGIICNRLWCVLFSFSIAHPPPTFPLPPP